MFKKTFITILFITLILVCSTTLATAPREELEQSADKTMDTVHNARSRCS